MEYNPIQRTHLEHKGNCWLWTIVMPLVDQNSSIPSMFIWPWDLFHPSITIPQESLQKDERRLIHIKEWKEPSMVNKHSASLTKEPPWKPFSSAASASPLKTWNSQSIKLKHQRLTPSTTEKKLVWNYKQLRVSPLKYTITTNILKLLMDVKGNYNLSDEEKDDDEND